MALTVLPLVIDWLSYFTQLIVQCFSLALTSSRSFFQRQSVRRERGCLLLPQCCTRSTRQDRDLPLVRKADGEAGLLVGNMFDSAGEVYPRVDVLNLGGNLVGADPARPAKIEASG